MATTLDSRLIKAGCQSTRVRVLATDHPSDLEGIVARIEAASKKAAGDDAKEAAFDSICESWYLSDETDDKKAIAKLRKDLDDMEKAVGG